MKSLYVLLCLVFLTINNYGQKESYFKIENDSVSQLIVQDSISSNIKEDSISSGWFVENWETSTYNPYKKEVKTYPFNIIFTDSMYASPMKRHKVITSRYGWRNRKAHKGIDIDLVSGEPVKSMFDGKVRYVNYHSDHGNIIVIRHNNGLETSYSHLSKQLVKVNDTIFKGQIIGKGGTTGNARGSHLHLEVSYRGVYIHPEYLFDFGEKNKVRSQNVWVTSNWATPYVHNSKRESTISICKTYEEALESQKNQNRIYVVKKGDTLYQISNKYQVSITSICKTNAIKKSSTLRIGQQLVLIN